MGPRKSKKTPTSSSDKVLSGAYDESILPVSSANYISRNPPRVQLTEKDERTTPNPAPDRVLPSRVDEEFQHISSQVTRINPILPDIINASVSQHSTSSSGRLHPRADPYTTGIRDVSGGVGMEPSQPAFTTSTDSVASPDSASQGLVQSSDRHGELTSNRTDPLPMHTGGRLESQCSCQTRQDPLLRNNQYSDTGSSRSRKPSHRSQSSERSSSPSSDNELPATQRRRSSSQDQTVDSPEVQVVDIRNSVKENLVYEFKFDSTSDCQMLVISELPTALKDQFSLEEFPQRFLVRECYKDLYMIAKDIMIKDIKRRPVIVFTGTPGIGKSVFLLYFVCRYLSEATNPEDKRFALETERGLYQCFSPTEIENEFKCFEDVAYSRRVKSVFPLRDVLLLTDIAEKAPPGRPRGKWKLLFCSPDPVRYKQYMKQGNSYKFYLPTWKREELRMFNPDESTWLHRYKVYGGVPRFVFPNIQKYSITMKEALGEKGPETAKNFFTRGIVSTIDSDISYILVHVNPMLKVDAAAADAATADLVGGPPVDAAAFDYGVEFSYSDRVFSLASGYVLDKLVEMDKTSLILAAKHLFNTMGNPASEIYGGATAGLYFEKLCLWLDPIAGTTITAISLTQGCTSLTFRLPSMGMLDKGWKTSKSLSADVLYQPAFNNFELGDAFCVTNIGDKPSLVVLQFTVADKHPVMMHGLKAIQEAYPSSVEYNTKILLFVTPAGGKLNSVQKIVTQTNTEIQNTKASGEFQQYVYRRQYEV